MRARNVGVGPHVGLREHPVADLVQVGAADRDGHVAAIEGQGAADLARQRGRVSLHRAFLAQGPGQLRAGELAGLEVPAAHRLLAERVDHLQQVEGILRRRLEHHHGLAALMAERFGRSEAFLVVDGDSGQLIEILDNVSAKAPHGAGTATANALKAARVQAVVSGRFGSNALDALWALGIEAWTAPPGINAALALIMLVDGRLEELEWQVHH